MNWNNVYFINGTAYAGKSTMVKCLAEKYGGIACTENYHEQLMDGLDPDKFPGLCYTRDLQDWHDFIRRSPDEYEAWIDETSKECWKTSANRVKKSLWIRMSRWRPFGRPQIINMC